MRFTNGPTGWSQPVRVPFALLILKDPFTARTVSRPGLSGFAAVTHEKLIWCCEDIITSPLVYWYPGPNPFTSYTLGITELVSALRVNCSLKVGILAPFLMPIH